MSNNGMHPTADTAALIYINGSGRRVMPGVRLLGRYKHSADGMSGRGGWRGGLSEANPAVAGGLTSMGWVAEGMAQVERRRSRAGWREVG